VRAISEQIRLSEKYPVLVNEGIVALSLLSGGAGGQQGGKLHNRFALTRYSLGEPD